MGSLREQLGKLFGGGNTVTEQTTLGDNSVVDAKTETRVNGKIIKVDESGYGFISSKEIPFTRIFFHWTSLRPDTKNFKELKNGMQVSFVAVSVPDKGYRAIKIKVEETTAKVKVDEEKKE